MEKLLVIIPLLLFFSCMQTTNASDWSDAPTFAVMSKITKVQPMTGIVLWDNNPKRNTDAISLEFKYLKYSDIVISKGVCDFDKIDAILDDIASRNHHAILRFWYTYPGYNPGGVPQYIKEIDGYQSTEALCEGKITEFPDWRHEELQLFHLDFYAKFAERYNNDKRIAFLQTGFGLWAEYHIYDGPFILGQTFPSKEFQKKFFEMMGQLFTNLTWSVSKDSAYSPYSPYTIDDKLLKINFGVFDDSFMHATHSVYNTQNWNIIGRDKYKISPAGGEFGYYTTYDQEHVLDYPSGIHGRNFENQAQEFHITYMIGNNQPNYQTMTRIKEASMACGYKFHILDCRVKEDSLRITVMNKGVAPFYRDAYIAVDGVRSEITLKGLIDTNSVVVVLPISSNSSIITIESDYLVGNQVIEYSADIK